VAIKDVLKVTKTDQLFGFHEDQELIPSKSFVLVYSPTKRDCRQLTFSLHKDVACGENVRKHIMSVVYTIKSEDCIGGALGVSNRPDGDIFHTRDMTI
jgi:hypothetical protein